MQIAKRTMQRIKIIRHSERLDCSHPFYWMFYIGHYWCDTPLTKRGYQLARSKGISISSPDFDPKYIYTSPYNRAMTTATCIKEAFPDTTLVIEPLISEYQPYFAHTISLYPDGIPTTYDGMETGFSYPESKEQLSKRVSFILDKIVDKHTDDLIIVTHGGIIKSFIELLRTLFPDLKIDSKSTPYLTTISFDVSLETRKISSENIIIE